MNVYLTDIEHGKGERARFIYASLYNAEDHSLVISATLDYILEVAPKRGYVFVKPPVLNLPIAKTADGQSVTAQNVLNALCDVMDGEEDHDYGSATGHSEEDAARLVAIRAAVKPLWQIGEL